MLDGLRNLFSSQGVPYADPKASIPLGAVLKHDWFELWYQPKIELKSLHLVGAEALVRALKTLCDDDALRARLGAAARRWAVEWCHPAHVAEDRKSVV